MLCEDFVTILQNVHVISSEPRRGTLNIFGISPSQKLFKGYQEVNFGVYGLFLNAYLHLLCFLKGFFKFLKKFEAVLYAHTDVCF